MPISRARCTVVARNQVPVPRAGARRDVDYLLVGRGEASNWVAAKLRWDLSMDAAEAAFVRAQLATSDNGPEFIAKALQNWIVAAGAKTAYIAPGSPWENGYIESFNARLRDELLDGESSKAGAGTTIRSGRTPRSAIALRLRRCSCQPSPRGRLRNPGQLRRPRCR